MIEIPPYHTDRVLYHTARTLVVRAHHAGHGESVILKMPASDGPTIAEINRLKHEYEVVGKREIPGIIRVHEILKHEGRPVLVCEDIGGISLAEDLRSSSPEAPLNIERFLDQAQQLARAVAAIHQHGIIHKDLKPANFIINRESGDIRIADFGMASLLHREDPDTAGPIVMTGSLSYSSPEQTGRMNRAVDHRTDLYSLGVCLYQMLTGVLPFDYDEPIAMIHAHIARAPRPVCAVDPRIPAVLGDIVLKLMEKNAEDRYQSAYGLARDLERCHERWQRDGHLDPFPLARHDLVDRLQISQKLYGREPEVERLLSEFELVCRRGRASLMLVAGYSGIGKTSLVHELHKPIVARRGHFVSGKYDQLGQDIPYSALIHGLRALVRQVLEQSTTITSRLATRLRDAMAGHGQVMVNAIPELTQLIGPQPPVPPLGPTESANRSDRLFAELIATFARREHPLVIFIDDLQWADAASLRLLRRIASGSRSQYLLLLGAYRDNEVDATHPLSRTLGEITEGGSTYHTMRLSPLRLADIQALLADTLSRSPDDVAPLAQILSDRTLGNPFFLRQLLAALYEQRVIELDLQRGRFTWHRERLDAIHLARDVLELLLSTLRSLDPQTQEVLRRAACIGNTFELNTLATICETTTREALARLWPTLEAGLVLPVGRAHELIGLSPRGREFDQAIADPRLDATRANAKYRFLHDRVQQAAYALIPDQERSPLHLQIGRLMWRDMGDEVAFETVNHLDIGAELITEPNERHALARLNLQAALKAKRATAYQTATRYADTGMTLLGNESPAPGSGDPSDGAASALSLSLALSLAMEQAECAFLCGDFRRAESLFQDLLDRSDDEIVKGRIRAKQLTILVSENRMDEALVLGREALAALGIEFETDPTEAQWQAQDERFRELRGDRTIAQLVEGPPIDDPRMEAALEILLGLSPPSYQTRPRRLHGFINVITMALNIGLEYGYAPAAGYAYVTYAFCITNMDRYEEAYEYGQLGMALNERLGNVAMQGRVTTFFTCFAQYWCEHFRACEPYWTAAYHQLRETGDYVHANFMVLTRTAMRIAQGVELGRLHREITDDIAWIAPMGYELCLRIVQMQRQLIANLAGLTPDRMSLDAEGFCTEQYLAWMRQQHENPMGMGYYYAATSMLRYCYGDYRGAIEAAEQYLRYEPGVSGMVVIAQNGLYYPLAIFAAFPDMSEDERATYRPVLDRCMARAGRWAQSGPANFEGRHLLLLAERARVEGRDYEAFELYDRAIDSARTHDFVPIAGLAGELAAQLYYQRGRRRMAQIYLEDARYAYQEWGAMGKLAQLDERWLDRLPPRRTSTSPSATSTSQLGDQLDLMSIVTTSRIISSEIVEDSLVEKIMMEIIKNAGADRGVLLLRDEHDEIYVRALGRIEGQQLVVSRPEDPAVHDRVLCRAVVDDTIEGDRYLEVDDAITDPRYREQDYVRASAVRSILCIPVHRQEERIALLYLENHLNPGVFTPQRVELLGLIAVQIAISLENAAFYANVSRLNADLERRVEERTRELRATQKELLDEAHKAGMAEVASETVHNVGNVLNSVLTSVDELRRLNARKSFSKLAQVNQLLDAHHDRLPELFAPDGRGPMLAQYLRKLETLLREQSTTAGQELERLHECTTLIRDVVHVQQSYAGSTALVEEVVDLRELLDNLLVLQANALTKHGVRVERRYAPVAPVRVQKTKLMHVLLNLLKNAKEAMAGVSNKQLTLTLDQQRNTVRLRMTDHGCGIPPAMRDRIFRHGFTTKTNGRGLGLHSSINYMRSMQGDLRLLPPNAHTEAGTGTTFMLCLPADTSRPTQE
ncbi:MAG: AAA family ATPase [Myxococcota bacterium]